MLAKSKKQRQPRKNTRKFEEYEEIVSAILNSNSKELSFLVGRYDTLREFFQAEIGDGALSKRDLDIYKLARVHTIEGILLACMPSPQSEAGGKRQDSKLASECTMYA
jgi:hypothetical protein